MKLASAFACLAILSASAAEPERLAEARALMHAIQIDKQMDAMVSTMSTQVARQLNELGQGGRDPRVAAISMQEAMLAMRERASSPGGLLDIMTEAYAEQFTLDELRQIRAFYESPVGHRLLEASPRIMQRVLERSPLVTKETLAQVCRRVKARLERENIPEGQSKECPELAK